MVEELTEFEQKVLKYIDDYGSVSCVELSREFGEGDFEIYIMSSEGIELNIIKAFGLSESLCNAISNMVSRGDIVETPCSPIVYLIDGVGITLPIVKKIPQNGYKKMHWMPTVYDSYEKGIRKIRNMTKGDKEGEASIFIIRQRHKETYGKC